MKANLRDLNRHLTGKLKPLYWFSGEETFLVDQASKDVQTLASKQGYTLERVAINATFQVAQFFELTHELSLFANKRCLVFTLASKAPAAILEAIAQYCAAPDDSLILIFKGPKLTQKDQQKSWYKAVDKIGLCVPIWPIDHTELPRYLTDAARRFNLKLTPESASLLANMTEGNLFGANQILEKLSHLHPTGTITPEMLHTNAHDHAHFDIFDLVSAVLTRNTQRAHRILDALFSAQAEPNMILWALAKEFRLLATFHDAQKRTPLPTLFKKHHIWEKRGREITQAMRHYSYQTCLSQLQKAAEIDRVLKGAQPGDIKRLLTELTLCDTGVHA